MLLSMDENVVQKHNSNHLPQYTHYACTWRDDNFFPRPRAENVDFQWLNKASNWPDSQRRVAWRWRNDKRSFSVARQTYNGKL